MKILEKINSFGAKKIALLLGASQGLLLLIIYELRSFDIYTSVYSALLITLFVVPITIVLTLEDDLIDNRFFWKIIGLFSVLTFLLAFYFGFKQSGNIFFEGSKWRYFSTPSFFVTFLIAWFIFLLFFQSSLQEKRLIPSYQSQFNNSWNNFLTVVLSGFFLSLLWGVLSLWAVLFKEIGIDIFATIFSKNWFYIPLTTIALASFISLLKSRIDAVETIRRILKSLFQSLLPLTLFMTTLFAVIILLSGVDTLWNNTKLGTPMLLWTTSLGLFLFNAVYQSGDEAPYGPMLNKAIQYSLCIFLVFMALSWYGLGSRISQYGWTINIAHAAIIIAILSCYTLAYSASNFLFRSKWQFLFRSTNSFLAIVIAFICVLLNTPLLNLEKITVNQHIDRYTTGVIDSSEIDTYYLAKKSGPYGIMAMEKLKQSDQYAEQTELQSNIEKAQKRYSRWDYKSNFENNLSDNTIRKNLRIVPLDAEIPDSIYTHLSDELKSKGCYKELKCSLIVQDLNKDNTPEYIFINGSGGFRTQAFMLTIKDTDKNQKTKIHQYRVNLSSNVTGLCCLHKEFDNGVKIEAKAPNWQDLVIGKKRFMIDSAPERTR